MQFTEPPIHDNELTTWSGSGAALNKVAVHNTISTRSTVSDTGMLSAGFGIALVLSLTLHSLIAASWSRVFVQLRSNDYGGSGVFECVKNRLVLYCDLNQKKIPDQERRLLHELRAISKKPTRRPPTYGNQVLLV